MPRRKLSRHLRVVAPDETTLRSYLSAYDSKELYRNPESFPRVISRDLFGDECPLKLEVGCGCGEFLCALAKREASSNWVGIDISKKPLYKAVEIAASEALSNIKFIQADFRLVHPLLMADSLQAVYLHFPNPHTKNGFRKHRLFTEKFLDQMHKALVVGGKLSVMTDLIEFFVDMLQLAEADSRFRKSHKERYLVGFDAEMKSRFQRMWERHGLPTLRFELEKAL